MTLRLYPLPTLYDQDVALVKAATPVETSSFYVRRPWAVPWSVNPTAFVLETDEPSAPHTISINRTDKTTIVPGTSMLTLHLQLVQGVNRIDLSTPTQSAYFTVASTGVETWFRALGREFYLAVNRRLRDVESQLFTPWSTRLSAHLLPFGDLFLPARMPKIHQTRLAILSSTGGRQGHGDGVIQRATAMTYSTPWVTRPRDTEFAVPDRDHIYPGVTTHPTTGEDRAGRVFDVWHANYCAAARQALLQLAVNMGAPDVPEPKPIRLVDVTDYQVLLQFAGGPTEVHTLDALAADCAVVEFSTDCAGNVRAYMTMAGTFDIMMSTPQLPFDEVVENAINFSTWDADYLMDGGFGAGDAELDIVDPDDPFGDGFLGVSLSGRFDGSACLDSGAQIGTRLVKFVSPLADTSSFTPEEHAAGSPMVIDGAAGAPAPSSGNTLIWVVSPLHYLYEGDYIRFEEPDVERQITSAWPVDPGTGFVKSATAAATTSTTTTAVSVSVSAGFFSPQHRGMGIRINGSAYACIVDVSADGLTATVAGNPSMPIGGPYDVAIYEPLRDRTQTIGAPYAGYRTYAVTLASALTATYADQTQVDHRPAPRAMAAAGIGDDELQVAFDTKPAPGERLYVTTSTSYVIESANLLTTTHPTTGFKNYLVVLTEPLTTNVTLNQALLSVKADVCWPHGDPVTPLGVIAFAPSAYLTP